MNLVDILACPRCDYSLEEEEDGTLLRCRRCRTAYPVVNGIPRFVKSDSYVESFSYQWQKQARSLVDSISGTTFSHDTFLRRTGLTPEHFKGKLVLDAGCGTGRFMEVVKNFGGIPVGIDMAYSVNEAREILGTSAHLVQGDLMAPPFKFGCFDIIFSIGVIHHTKNAARAFANLASLLKPGGFLSVWVYSNEGLGSKVYNSVSAIYRLFTTRMPKRLVWKLSYASIPLVNVPVLGPLSYLALPRSRNPVPELRVLDTFDWYSPKYQSKHSYEEVKRWYGQAEFSAFSLPDPVSVMGRKPL